MVVVSQGVRNLFFFQNYSLSCGDRDIDFTLTRCHLELDYPRSVKSSLSGRPRNSLCVPSVLYVRNIRKRRNSDHIGKTSGWILGLCEHNYLDHRDDDLGNATNAEGSAICTFLRNLRLRCADGPRRSLPYSQLVPVSQTPKSSGVLLYSRVSPSVDQE